MMMGQIQGPDLLLFLNVVDPVQEQQGDWLRKVRFVYAVRQKCRELNQSHLDISVNERMVRFKG